MCAINHRKVHTFQRNTLLPEFLAMGYEDKSEIIYEKYYKKRTLSAEKTNVMKVI